MEMSNRFPVAALLILFLAGFSSHAGCGQGEQSAPPPAAGGPDARPPAAGGPDAEGQAASFDPHDVAITEDDVERPTGFADAVARIEKYRREIETAAGGTTPALAHRALDELDYVLQWLPGIARDSGVPKESWEAVNTAAGQLRELFERVHQNIDNRVAPDFAAVAAGIDQQIRQLRVIAERAGASP